VTPAFNLGRIHNKYLILEILAFSYQKEPGSLFLWELSKRYRKLLVLSRDLNVFMPSAWIRVSPKHFCLYNDSKYRRYEF
jgi:hypothetical protein